ncbi:glycosyltransferase [Sphingobacterium sp. SYP-B4668]|uniref:glycosyltransferase n=1 Tax=Sphingobacterium sp. SYP-B4668 TaxID=2996035 RepID=UPI0022DD65B9|nr:glycosyltransferase family 2 protein [Sphingobacterium sp. SYP-B4668]
MDKNHVLDELAIIILNYNSSTEVQRQVDTLLGEGFTRTSFYIIDNDSTDAKKLEDYCRVKNIFFHEMGSNLGYAHANNWAIRRAKTDGKDFFLILNPDMHIDADCIYTLCLTIAQDPSLAVVGPRIMFNNQRDMIFSDGGLLIPKRGFEGGHVNCLSMLEDVSLTGLNYNIDYVNGSAMLFRWDVLEDIGFMYEHLFMYYEESEWCYRIKQSNRWKIAINTDVSAYQTDSSRGEVYEYYMTRNRIWLCRKYKGNIYKALKNRWRLIKKIFKRRDLSNQEKRSFIKKVISGIRDGFKLDLHPSTKGYQTDFNRHSR